LDAIVICGIRAENAAQWLALQKMTPETGPLRSRTTVNVFSRCRVTLPSRKISYPFCLNPEASKVAVRKEIEILRYAMPQSERQARSRHTAQSALAWAFNSFQSARCDPGRMLSFGEKVINLLQSPPIRSRAFFIVRSIYSCWSFPIAFMRKITRSERVARYSFSETPWARA